jgi:hypothetical protein
MGQAVSVSNTRALWHRRFAHQSSVSLTHANTLYKLGIEEKDDKSFCSHCINGSGRRKAIRTKHESLEWTAATEPLQRIHFDLHGPMSVVLDGQRYKLPTWGGATYVLVCVDEYTRYVWVYLLKHKSDASERIIELITFLYTQFKVLVRGLHSDGGKEFINSDINNYCKLHGINQTYTTVDHPSHNGICERMIGILLNMVRSMLSECGGPHELWGEAVLHAAYVHNRTPLRRLKFDSSFKILYGRMPDMSKMHVFGANVLVYVQPKARGDTQPRFKEAVYVGVAVSQNALRLAIPSTRTLIVSRDCKLDENSFTHVIGLTKSMVDDLPTKERLLVADSSYDLSITSLVEYADKSVRDDHASTDGSGIELTSMDADQELRDQGSYPMIGWQGARLPSILEEEYSHTHQSFGDDWNWSDLGNGDMDEITDLTGTELQQEVSGQMPEHPLAFPVDGDVEVSLPDHATEVVTRYGRVSQQSEHSYAFTEEDYLYLVVHSDFHEPLSYKEAVQSAYAPEWKKSMEEEMESLGTHQAWKMVARPKDAKVIRGRWVYKGKHDSTGAIVRFKSRFVCKGFQQTYGADYVDTYAPVAKLKSFKLVLLLAITYGLVLAQIDFVTAFLHASVDELIYVEQPEGYDDGTGMVCQLLKALYGLKQAPKCWFDELSQAMLTLRYVQCKCDPCVYLKRVTSAGAACYIVVAIYVDDTVIAHDEAGASEWNSDKTILGKRYKIKDLGTCDWILNMRVIRDDNAGTITLDQSTYIARLLADYNMEQCKPVDVVSVHKELVLPPDGVATSLEVNGTKHSMYRSLVGALLYAANCTRLDIAYTVGVLSRQLSAPCQHHLDAAMGVLRYLSGTANRGLVFKGSNNATTSLSANVNSSFALGVHTDADWAGDKRTSRSTSGVLVNVNGCPISWVSKRQDIVALSTAEAEYIALAAGVKEVLWYRNWITEVVRQVVSSVPVYCDNTAAVAMVTNYGGDHKQSKHINMRYHFIQDELKCGTIDIKWIPTTEQKADILTKVLVKPLFKQFVDQLLSVVMAKGSVKDKSSLLVANNIDRE